MTSIHDLQFFSLRQYKRAGSPELERPDQCPECGSESCFWKNGFYMRQAREGEIVATVKVPRFKCRVCQLVVSVLLGFLIPYRRYSSKTVADAIREYLQEFTTYRKAASEVSADRHELPQPSPSRVFEWVDDFTRHCWDTIGMRINRACLRERIESNLGKTAQCPNSGKAHSEGKSQQLDLAATIMVESLLLVKSTQVLRRLRAYLLESVEGVYDIFCGHHSRLSLSQNSEHAF